ncbi:MAG: hypothetical protein AAGU11_18720 [Syntrophobacteraceae bacterium]
MLEGIPIEIGGEKYIVPPMGLAGLKRTNEIRKKFDQLSEDEQLDAMIGIVHAALVRNYPDLILEDIHERIHAHEVEALASVLPDLMRKSGLTPRGEAKPGSTAISTGDGSTAT